LNAGIKPWSEVEALALALDHHQMLALKVHQLHGSVKDAAVSFYILLYIWNFILFISNFFYSIKFGDFLENQFVSEHVSRIRELSGIYT
jgi:hypothetical protein